MRQIEASYLQSANRLSLSPNYCYPSENLFFNQKTIFSILQLIFSHWNFISTSRQTIFFLPQVILSPPQMIFIPLQAISNLPQTVSTAPQAVPRLLQTISRSPQTILQPLRVIFYNL